MMCAWLLLSAASRDRRHLSSLWEESTSLGGWGVGGLTTDWLSPFILSNNLLLRPHKEGLPREGEPVLPMCWLQEDDCLLCFEGDDYTPTSMRCFPFFGTGGNSSFRDDRCCAFRNRTGPNENEFFFFFLLSLWSSLISAASRENYTLLKDAVIFLATCQWFLKKYFPPPPPSTLSTDGPVGFPIFTDSQSIFCSACCDFVSHSKRPTKWKQSFWYITTFFGKKKKLIKKTTKKQKLVIKLYPQLANSRQRSPTADISI